MHHRNLKVRWTRGTGFCSSLTGRFHQGDHVDIVQRFAPGLAILDSGMKIQLKKTHEGAVGYLLLWLLGVPASILLVIFLLRGCT